MSKQAERFGLAVAKVLCCIGETINTSSISKEKVDSKKRFIDNDREAIQQDWNIAGEEVRISLENYGKEHSQGNLFTPKNKR